VLNTIEVPYVP